jgi:shikimate dehydrogenase
MSATGRRCAVLGSPIGHSLSPVLHRAAYRALGLDWEYDAVDVRSDGLAKFLDGLDARWRGLSLTMPLKRSVLPLLDEVSDLAVTAGAVNTVLLEEGRLGDNTDVPGAAAAVRERHPGPVGSAVVLGGGATAGSVVLALADLGCRHVTLLVRDPARVRETVAAAGRHPRPPLVDVRPLSEPAGAPVAADLLVSTIPAGAQTEAVLRLAEPVPVLFDVVYDPWPTPLAAYAAATGRTFVSGLDLLVHQARGQLTLMTGIPDPPLDAIRAAGLAALSQRAGRGS